MRKYKKFMVCVDLSAYSKENIEYAVEFAGGEPDVKILLYNVINQRDVNSVSHLERLLPAPDRINMINTYKITAKRYIEEISIERYKEMRKLVETNFPDIKDSFSYLVGVGYPFEEILKTAEQKNIDIIFIGTKGRGNIAKTLLGSNAEKVFRHATVPVVSIRNRNRSNWGRKSGGE
ncbi:MAG: universal stress protein, partial [Desulfamplus sp.]|nr:universal stress protein [Desulfamplus sp.]